MPQEIVEGFQLSPQQKRLWLLQRGDQSLPYRAQCAVLIEGNLNTEILEAAAQNVVNRHEILRTTFHPLPGMTIPIQVITDGRVPSLHHYDLSGWNSQEQEAKIAHLFHEISQQPFDFEQGPLLHISLAILSPCKHILLVSLPALCADAAAIKNLVREISRSYAACLCDEELSDKPMQYADLAEWQNELLEAEDAQAAKDYWHRQDISTLLTLKLPWENQLSAKQGFEPQFLTSTMDPEMVAKIEALAQKYDASPFAFLLACWQTLLWRLIAQSDIVVGTAYDGRIYEELQEAGGLFAKYLPLRCHLHDNLQFGEILMQVRESTREVYEWQEYFSWEYIEGTTGNVREPSFFPFCFDFEEQSARRPATDVSFSIYKQHTCIDRFKVKLSCLRQNNSLIVEFHYDSDVFRAEDIKRLAEEFHALSRSAIRNPEATISELEILSDVEHYQLLVEFNKTKADYPADRCVHQLFEEQVRRTADNVAVVFEDQQLTYAELNARANQLAHYLQALGVGPEVLVTICMERSLEMVIGLLGILKAGGAYVPSDPAYPEERLSLVLEDTRTPVLLTQKRQLERLPKSGAHLVCLDTGWEAIAGESKENPVNGVTAQNLAYGIYTSGSTGGPKCSLIPHSAICNHLFWKQEVFQLTEADCVLQQTPFTFDVSVWEFFLPLATGARLLLARPGGHWDSAYLVKLIAEQQDVTLFFVSSMLRNFLDQQGLEACISSLKRVWVGAGALPVELQERFFDRTGATLYHGYGPTEATIGVTFLVCEKKNKSDRKTVPIGRPISNTQIYLLDQRLKPVPIGAPGELHIGGAALARGYLNRFEQTAESFIPNPSSEEPGGRLYKTGDLARYLPDGNIEFMGRIDHQVKVHGFRVEPGEIKAALGQHPALRETVVVVYEDAPDDPSSSLRTSKRLVAYAVPKQEASPTIHELRSFLQGKLPGYMVPAAFVLLNALPLLPNGKVNRRALPAPDLARSELKTGFVAPRTPVEETLAAIWAEVLGLERVGAHDNFFELGGHSLLATQLISQVRRTFHMELPLRSLFETTTVAELSRVMIAQEAKPGQTEKIARTLKRIKNLSVEDLEKSLQQKRRERDNA